MLMGTRSHGKDVVEGYGGEVVLLPLLAGHSTSEIISRWRGSQDAAKK